MMELNCEINRRSLKKSFKNYLCSTLAVAGAERDLYDLQCAIENHIIKSFIMVNAP